MWGMVSVPLYTSGLQSPVSKWTHMGRLYVHREFSLFSCLLLPFAILFFPYLFRTSFSLIPTAATSG